MPKKFPLMAWGEGESTRRSLYSGMTMVVIVVSLVCGGASLLFLPQLTALADRITQRVPSVDRVNSDPRLTDDQRLMYTLSHVGGNKAVAAVRTVVARHDQRFVPVLIEMLDANESRRSIVGAGTHEHVEALEMLTGENFRKEAIATQKMAPYWKQWYRETQFTAPEGFVGWKGKLLSRFDPGYRSLLRDDVPVAIRSEEIHYSEFRDRTPPSLDRPALISDANLETIFPEEPVFGIRVNGRSRAYPARTVAYHKAVNDVIEGVPVSLMTCSLLGTTICYDARNDREAGYRFTATGLNYRGNELFRDRETSALWCQVTGECVLGEQVSEGTRLRPLPLVLTSWREWLDEHPDTQLAISANEESERSPPARRPQNGGNPESRVPSASPPRSATSEPTSVFVLASEESGHPKAYSLSTLVREKVINDRVGKTPVVLIANNGELQVESRRRGSRVSSVEGAEVRAFQRTTEVFRPAADSEAVLDEAGQRWEITEEGLLGPGNRLLPRIEGVQAQWIGWRSFHPQSELYEPGH